MNLILGTEKDLAYFAKLTDKELSDRIKQCEHYIFMAQFSYEMFMMQHRFEDYLSWYRWEVDRRKR